MVVILDDVLDFSLTSWKVEKNIDALTELSGLRVRQLLDDLGVAAYLLSESCHTNSTSYSLTVGGWNDGMLL
jgi:hypothetical protein